MITLVNTLLFVPGVMYSVGTVLVVGAIKVSSTGHLQGFSKS